jgi:tetratricopeptide (TPR) repeat protein
MPGREDEECFPPALRYKYDRRGHQTAKRADPLAADFREVGEGRRLAFLKLVAGMLGVGLDELVRRDQTRRQRHLAYLAAASIAGMVVTSTLAATAIQTRNEARDQRKQAEALIAFMVGDLKDKLEPIGKLDVLDGVGSRVLAYYSKQNTSELSDDALLQRSRALSLMGKVAFDRGNLRQAEALYRQATQGTAEAVRRSPGDAQAVFDHAQNVFYLGEVARFSGRPAQAEAAYREYQRLANRMVALQPDNLKYRMEVFYANEDVGISTYYQHRFVEAGRLFESAADPIEKLASLYPDNRTFQKEFATVLAWDADAQRSQGHLNAAINARQRQIAVLERLLSKSPDSDARARLITAHEGLGILFAEKGQLERSVQEVQSAMAATESLIPIEPDNAQWRSIAADARLQLALTLLSMGRRDESAQQAGAGCGLASGLPSAYADARNRLAMMCATTNARLALAEEAPDRGLQFAGRALAAAKAQHSQDPTTDRYKIAMAYRLLGDIRQRSGDFAMARDAWSAGLNQLPDKIAERPFEMSERIQLLRRLNRTAEAAPLQARLDSIGYRASP